MARIELKATELTNTDVDFVALVKRGANRIPFRITKGDDAVLDLYKIGRRMFQKADPIPAIAAIVTRKNEVDPSVAKALLKACGLGKVRVAKDDSDVITITGENAKFDGAVLVKLDGDFAVAVTHTNLQKAFPDAHYVQGLSSAHAGFSRTVKAAIAEAESFADARDAIQKAAEEFSTYVSLLADHMPNIVLKAEQAIGTGNATGGSATDQETGPGLGGQANGKGRAKKDGEPDKGDVNGDDPEMPGKNAKIGTRAAKADAGKNGTGAGFELGGETGGDDSAGSRASQDDDDEEIDAKPGAPVSGDTSGMPAKAKAPTKKAEAIAGAKAALAKAQAMKDEDDEQQDDDSTNGAQSKLPAKAKSPTDLGGEHMAKEAHTWVATDIPVRTVGDSGEGSRQASETGEMDKRPEDNAEAEASESGGKVAGKVKGKTLSLDGVPATAIAPCDAGGVHAAKNDGDAELGKKGKGPKQTPEDYLSGSGAQENDVQTLKSDAAVMQAIQALAKSVKEGQAAVSKSVTDLSARVEQVAVMAKKTDAALNGTVFNQDVDDRQVWTQKSADRAPPLMDTGYSRRSA